MKVILVRARAIDPAVNKVAKTLSEDGHDVKLLVWDRQHTLGTEEGDGYTVRRFNLKAPYDKFTVLFYLPIWWIYEFFFLLKNKCNVIHACDLDTLIPAIIIKLVRGLRLCYTIYDFYANNLPDGRFPQLRKLIRSLVASVEKFGIRFTDVLFLVDESRLEQVKGARIKKLVYIYNSPPDYFAARGKPGAVSITDTSAITMFYAGAIHKSRGLEYAAKAVEEVENVRLVVAGTGPDKGIIEDACRRCERIQFLGQIPYTEVIERTVAADILFALYDPAIPNNKYASPNKLFEAMMCAKPIIVSDGSSMVDIVREENCGLVVPYADVAAIQEAIVKLKSDGNLRQAFGENGRRAYEKRYNWSIMQKRLISAYREIAQNSHQSEEKVPNQLRVCVVTFPFTEAFVTPLSNLVEILRSLSDGICVITAGVEDAMITTNRGIQTYRIRQKKAKNVFARIARYMCLQIKTSFMLAMLSRNTDVYVFFMETGALLPMLTARLAAKKVVWVLPSSLVKMVEHHKDPFSNVLVCLQAVDYRLSNRIVLYSENLIKKWHLEKHRNKISIAHEHFLDFDAFKVQKPLNGRGNLVGYIGRLSREKGILNFMEAIPKVVETTDETTFLIGGDGQLRPRVEEYANKPSNKVKFVGWIPHDKLPVYLNELRLLVVPSYTEAGPYVAFEAMACGTPVLGAAVGLMADLLSDGENGFIMENNSPECIARSIIRVLAHPDLEQIAHNARALVEREFTHEAAVERYRRVLENLGRETKPEEITCCH